MLLARPRRLLLLLTALALAAPLAPTAVEAHVEREVAEPEDGVFPAYRGDGPAVVVCKPDSAERIEALPAPLRARNEALLDDCAFEHIQPAVNAVAADGEPGTRILVLPGVYREEPSRQSHDTLNGAPLDRPELADECAEIVEGAAGSEEGGTPGGEQALTYPQQVTCPHFQNLIAVHGDTTPDDDSIACDGNLCDLQIEGTGARPTDVIIDGKFGSGFLNGIKGDRAGGLYLTNLQAQHFEFNGVYIIETGGATVDDAVGSYNHEYGFLSFQSYVRYLNCVGQANGDSAIYPGASPDLNRELGLFTEHRDEAVFGTEVTGCRGHHNALGYSGTTGNSNFVHHNEFDHNATGLAQDSLFPGHPGTPQNHTLIEDNLFHSNNVNFYARTAHQGICDEPLEERDYEDGAVCPAIPLPVGTGIITAGGNFNWFHGNRLYDNWRQGTVQFWVPAELREGQPDPDAHNQTNCGADGDQPCPPQETSHWNTYSANVLAEQAPFGLVQPNGADFAWDVEGQGNCWDQSGDDANTSAAGDVTYRAIQDENAPPAPSFPDCGDSRQATYSPATAIFTEAGCVEYDSRSNPEPAGCRWFDVPAVPEGRTPQAPTLERLAGTDRVETAIRAAQEGYPSRARTVVLARDDEYADALAGAPLAHARGGPLLLTGSDGLDPRVADEIRRLGAVQAILLGGPQALSDQVVADLRALGFGEDDVVRIAGADRFATAAQIATNLPATDALVAKGIDPQGQGWVDALAASSVAALLERPILLTETDRLPLPTAEYLSRGDVESIEIVGGEAAVSGDVEQELADLLDDVERLAGEDRYATSLAVARFALEAGADPTELWLTTGRNWPDGVAAGSAVAVDEGVMLLVGDEVERGAVASWLDTVHPYSVDGEDETAVADVLERVRILGGTAAVPTGVGDELRDTYGAQDGDARGDRSHGTNLRIGRFTPLGGADDAYAGVRGSVVLEERLNGTTRTRVQVEGLPTPAGTAHPVHVHREPCGTADNPHYRQDPDGVAEEPNEIQPGFVTGPGATGLGDSTVFHHPEDTSLSVVIHAPAAEGGAMQLCADLI